MMVCVLRPGVPIIAYPLIPPCSIFPPCSSHHPPEDRQHAGYRLQISESRSRISISVAKRFANITSASIIGPGCGTSLDGGHFGFYNTPVAPFKLLELRSAETRNCSWKPDGIIGVFLIKTDRIGRPCP